MEISPELRETLKKLTQADDETVAKLIREVGGALGASEKQLNNASANVGKYKKKLAKMDDRELDRTISNLSKKVDGETMSELTDELKKRGL